MTNKTQVTINLDLWYDNSELFRAIDQTNVPERRKVIEFQIFGPSKRISTTFVMPHSVVKIVFLCI